MASIIRTGFVGIRETFGRYSSTLQPGLNFYLPFAQKIHKLNTQINAMPLKFTVRTKDSCFCRLDLVIQYKLDASNAEKAFYSLRDPDVQTAAYVENIIRSEVPKMPVNSLFEDNDQLCGKVKKSLSGMLQGYGYTLVDTLVTDIQPEEVVKQAMNKVRASESLKDVAVNEAAASRIRIEQDAEAEKTRKRLEGEGIAAQRGAILKGYRENIEEVTNKLGIDNQTAVQLSLFSQYCDTLKDISTRSNTKVIFVPYSENGATQSFDRFRQALLEAQEAAPAVSIAAQ